MHGPDEPQGQLVIGAEDGRHLRVRGQAQAGLIARCGLPVAGYRLGNHPSRLPQGPGPGGSADEAGLGVLGPAHVVDGAVPQLQKVRDGVAHPADLVGAGRGVVVHERGVRDRHRHRGRQGQLLTPRPPGLHDDEPVDGLVGEPVDGLTQLLGGGGLHLDEVDGVVDGGGGLQHARGGQGLPGALDLLGQHADRLEGAAAQGLGGAVGGVAELVHRAQDPFAGVRTDVLRARRHAGDRLSGDSRQAGHVAHRRRSLRAPALPWHGERLSGVPGVSTS